MDKTNLTHTEEGVEVRITTKETYLHVFAQGKASLAMSIDLWTKISQTIQETKLKRVLLEDYFDTGSRTHLEAVRFAQKLKTLAVPIGSKFAVVCLEKKFKRNDFIASIVTQLSRYEGKIFLDFDEAKAWLLRDN